MSDIFKMNLKGRIKTLTIQLEDDFIQHYNKRCFSITFNNLGDSKSIISSPVNIPLRSMSFTFNNIGDLIQKIRKDSGKVIYGYDKKGNLIEVISENCLTGKFNKIAYTYSPLGYLKRQIHYDEQESITKLVEYKYDERGNMIESNNHVLIINFSHVRNYKYDQKDNLIELSQLEPRYGKKLEKFEYKYNEKNQLIEKIHSLEGTIDKIEEFTYGIESQIKDAYIGKKVTNYLSNGDIFFSERMKFTKQGRVLQAGLGKFYSYDKKGNLISKEYLIQSSFHYGDIKGIEKYIYVYDKFGNWIKKTLYKDYNYTVIATREIEYYDDIKAYFRIKNDILKHQLFNRLNNETEAFPKDLWE